MANSPDAAFSSPALLRSGKCIDPKRVNWQFYICCFQRLMSLYGIFLFLLFPLWGTQLCAAFQLVLACFHCILNVSCGTPGRQRVGPSHNNRKLFGQKLSLVLRNCNCLMDLSSWFLNYFCPFFRYCKWSYSVHECTSVSAICYKLLWVHAQIICLILGFWQSFSPTSKVVWLVYTPISNL